MAQYLMAVRIVTLALAVLVVFVPPVRADFEAGQAAWEAGDFVEAVEQWQAGAQAGEARSMLAMGRLYRTGIGVLQDDVAAYMWLNLAASRGELDAALERDELAASMTAEARAEGQRLAREWLPGADEAAGAEEADTLAKNADASVAAQDSAVAVPPEPESTGGGPPKEAILEAQNLLATLGYEPGPADGAWGERAAAAYQAFLRDAGLAPADELTPEALLALRELAEIHGVQAQEVTAPPVSDTTQIPPPEAVSEAQDLLAALGYEPGPADGVWGARTTEAYQAFLRDAGLPSANELSPDGLLALRTQAGEQQAAGGSATTATQAASVSSNALHRAVQAGDINGVEAALASGVDINTRDGGGWTPLMHAANKGYLLLIEPLLTAGADVNIRAPDGATALFMAVALGHSDVVAQLMKGGADITVRGPHGKTPVDVARLVYGEPDDAREKEEDPALIALLEGKTWTRTLAWHEFAALLGREPSATKVDPNGWSDLHWAAILDLPTLAEELLAEGMDVDLGLKRDNKRFTSRLAADLKKLSERTGVETNWSKWARDGETPLHMAALSNAMETAKVLLVHGAGIEAKSDSWVAMHYAVSENAVDIVELLLAHGADIDARADGNTPLHYAALLDAVEAVELLLDRGASIDARNDDGESPLHHAAENNAATSANVLLAHGAGRDAGDNAGNTPLHHAVRSNAAEMVELLLARGADVAARNAVGETPLHVAALHDTLHDTAAVTELLLARGADINARDTHDETPLDVANRKGSNTIAALLALTAEISQFQTLLEREPSAGAADENGWTDLHWAAVLDLPVLAEELLAEGAVVDQALLGDGATLSGGLRSDLDKLRGRIGYDGDGSDWKRRRQTPLHMAALSDAARTAQVLLAHGASVDAKDGMGVTPLHVAASSDAAKMTELLLDHGGDVDARNQSNETPLDVANAKRSESVAPLLAWADATSEFEALLGWQPSARSADENDWTDLHWTAVLNLPDAAQALLDTGAIVDHRLKNDGRPIAGGTGSRLSDLLGSRYNSANWRRKHQTALHFAVLNDASETTKVLVAHGADVNARDRANTSPLQIAVRNGNTAMADLLIVSGGNVNEEMYGGRTLLYIAVEKNAIDLTKTLLSRGAAVDVEDNQKRTPLHLAVGRNFFEIAEILIAHGADVDAKNLSGDSPLKLARLRGYDRLMTLLRPHSEDVIEGIASDFISIFTNVGVDADSDTDRKTGNPDR